MIHGGHGRLPEILGGWEAAAWRKARGADAPGEFGKYEFDAPLEEMTIRDFGGCIGEAPAYLSFGFRIDADIDAEGGIGARIRGDGGPLPDGERRIETYGQLVGWLMGFTYAERVRGSKPIIHILGAWDRANQRNNWECTRMSHEDSCSILQGEPIAATFPFEEGGASLAFRDAVHSTWTW